MNCIVTARETHTTMKLRPDDSISALAERMHRELLDAGIRVIRVSIYKSILTITTPNHTYTWSV